MKMKQKILLLTLALSLNLGFSFGQRLGELSFRHYGTAEGLPASEVYHVIQDQDHYLWFATDRGISRYDGYSFKNYTTGDGLTDNSITRFTLDQKGRIWCLTLNRKICYIENGKVKAYQHNDIIKTIIDSFKHSHVNTELLKLGVDEDNSLYLEFRKWLFKISIQGQVTSFPENINGSFLGQHDIHYIKVGDQTLRYLGDTTERIMIAVEDTKGNQQALYPASSALAEKKYYFSDYNDQSIVSSFGNILLKIGPDSTSITKLNSTILSPYLQPNGSLWVGTLTNGAVKVDPVSLEVQEKQLSQYSVTSILQDHEGGMWFTTLEAGVFYAPSLHHRHSLLPLKSSYIRSIDINSKGQFAIGYQPGFFQVIEGNKIIHNQDIGIFYYLKYFSDYELLINGKSSFILNLKTQEQQRLKSNYPFPINITKNYLLGQHELIQSDGQKIMPRNFKARAIYTQGEKQFIVNWNGAYQMQNDTLLELSQADSIFQRRFNDVTGNDKQVFLASFGIGVVVLEGDKFTVIDKSDGLSSNIITCLEMDGKDKLWVGTHRGLNLIDLSTAETKAYAIPIENVKEVTDIKLFRDTIWVASKEGLSFLPKGQAIEKPLIPIIQLEEIKVQEKILKQPQYLKDIPYSHNQLSFHYTGISFRHPKELVYKYRLNGLSTTFTETKARQITYSALGSGDYELEVYAGHNGQWSKYPIRIPFSIKPPFWFQTWFIALVSIIITLILFMIYKLRERHYQNQIAKEKELFELKSEALKVQINPHFMFNSLNSIQKFIFEDNKTGAAIYLAQFGDLLRAVLEHGGETLVSIEEEVELLDLYLQLEKLRFKERLSYQFVIDEAIETSATEMPPLLLQPFIENALLHGILPKKEGGKITISILKQNDQLCCRIDDNGVGRNNPKYPQKKKGHNSKGVSISKKRMEHLANAYNSDCSINIIDKTDEIGEPSGTTVQLLFPYIQTY